MNSSFVPNNTSDSEICFCVYKNYGIQYQYKPMKLLFSSSSNLKWNELAENWEYVIYRIGKWVLRRGEINWITNEYHTNESGFDIENSK